MSQTAVEWLIHHYKKLQSKGEKMSWNEIIEITELAKEMDKQNIISAYQQGYNNAYFNDPIPGEEYYNETFKKNK